MKRGDDDGGVLWLGLGALALLALSGSRKAEVEPVWLRDGQWVWPVPDVVIYTRGVGGVPVPVRYPAVVSQPLHRGGATPHYGQDIMFMRRSRADVVPQYTAAPEKDGTTASDGGMYFAPPGTPVVAARDGWLWSCQLTPRGWEVVIDHKGGEAGRPSVATYYSHLASVTLPHATAGKVDGKATQANKQPSGTFAADGRVRIAAGEVIGTMGGDPRKDRTHLRHLHFELWHDGVSFDASVDATAAMETWSRPAEPFVVR